MDQEFVFEVDAPDVSPFFVNTEVTFDVDADDVSSSFFDTGLALEVDADEVFPFFVFCVGFSVFFFLLLSPPSA